MSEIPEPDEQLVLKPGETLVLRYDTRRRLSMSEAQMIRERFEYHCPDNKILIVEADAASTSNEGEDLASR